MARPSTYRPEIVDAICVRLANGEPLAQICRDEEMPGLTTVWDWEKAHAGVSEAIARARDAGHDRIAAECLEIAEDGTNDFVEVQTKNGSYVKLRDEHVQRSKLRVETRLKLLAKWNPKKWGEKVQQEITGADGAPLGVQVVYGKPPEPSK